MKATLYTFSLMILLCLVSGCAYIAGWKDSEKQDQLNKHTISLNQTKSKMQTFNTQPSIQTQTTTNVDTQAGKILNPITP